MRLNLKSYVGFLKKPSSIAAPCGTGIALPVSCLRWRAATAGDPICYLLLLATLMPHDRVLTVNWRCALSGSAGTLLWIRNREGTRVGQGGGSSLASLELL